MREKKTFARRTRSLTSDEPRRKYLLVYEGKDTERIYFEGVNENRDRIGIDPLIELVPIARSYSEEGWSNPRAILDRVVQNLDETKTSVITYETLMNWIMEYLEEEDIAVNNRPLKKYYWDALDRICREKLCVSKSQTVDDIDGACTAIADALKEETGLENITENSSRFIENRGIMYQEGFDKICFVIDRDRKSFTSGSGQYEYVLDRCKEKGFGFYLTNPCFEFWLLLHMEDLSDLDEEKLLENGMATSTMNYAEHELRRKLREAGGPNFKKGGYNPSWFMERISMAIANERMYCEDEAGLEHNIGSRVGILLEEMMKKGSPAPGAEHE